jgi:hypothetical protein
MTTAEFVALAPSFPARGAVVVSGADIDAVLQLLNDAAAEIESSTSYVALVYDAKATVFYGDTRNPNSDVAQGVLWEYVTAAAKDVAIVLVANEFDPSNPTKNPYKVSTKIDVLIDLYDQFRVSSSHSRLYAAPRELFPFMTKVFYYNTGTGEVTFLKDHNPDFL